MRILTVLLAGCSASSSLNYLSPPSGHDGRTGMGALGTQLASALKATYRGQLEHVPPPVSLVPSDGSELALASLDAKIAIDGPIAHTELHFVFHNTERRTREGRFSVALPPDAAVGRFAMLTNGAWREARIVGREQGRVVYESFLKRRVDPALLEQDAGNAFSARIFPIPAEADKEIIIAYDHLVSAAHPYELALKGLPAMPHFAIAIDHDGDHREIHGDRKAPDDVELAIAPGSVVRTAGELFVARLDPVAESAREPLDHVAILVDTSASRATVMGRQAAAVEQLVHELPGDAEIVVAAYDHEVDELYRGRASNFRGAGDLLAHGALGASNLDKALTYAATTAMRRIVLVGDGTPTLGETDPAKLAAHLKVTERVDAIQVGTSIDRDTLGALIHAGVHPGGIYDAREPAIDKLSTSAQPVQAIAVAGATKVWPATTAGLAPGEPVWIFGHRAKLAELTVYLGDRKIALAAPEGAQVERIVARAEITTLNDELATAADKAPIAKHIEELALANHLVTSQTSLIVLETDADELRTLGPPTTGETIHITGRAPTIDPTSTSQGITLDRNYLRNIPVPGRTFEAALGAAAGSQNDGIGTSFSGSTSLENQYYVDGVNTTGLTYGTVARRVGAVRFGDDFGGFDGMPPPPGSCCASAENPKDKHAAPYAGTFLRVMQQIAQGASARAVDLAAKAELANPGDVSAILALGEALEAKGATALAARAYGSLIDLYPSRAELVRAAGERLDRLGAPARALAIDAYRRAIKERADQIGAYRLLAYDLLRSGDADGALALLDKARRLPSRASIARILGEDVQLIAATIVHAHPERRAELVKSYGTLPETPSVRFVLAWETDANDVDLHTFDRNGGHAWYASRTLASGGDLLDDVTDGYGPEMFVAEKPDAFPYHLAVHYYSKGPEGVGLGSVQVIRFADGALTVEDRPFVIQNDNAMVDLGIVKQ